MNTDILTAPQCFRLRKLIDEAENIVLCCHTNPDGDALGSMLGWKEYLRLLGKKAQIIVPDMFPDYLQWLPGAESILRYDKYSSEAQAHVGDADLIFCLDFNGLDRLGRFAPVIEHSHAKRVVIDHHPHPSIPACDLTISFPKMSSTCELVMRIVCQLGGFEQLDKQFAIPVYCGMMTDTGGFTYNSSTPEIFYLISLLLTKGIDKDKIYRNVYHNFSENRLRLVGYVLKDRLVVMKHSAYHTLTRQDLADYHFIKGDAEGIVNMPLQIKNVKLSISLREDTEEDRVLVSLRSVEPYKCNDIAAKYFNGGGHDYAAGGKLPGSMEEAEKVAVQALQSFEDKFR